MTKGKVIVVEGSCDGIGKTTQYNLLKEHLEKDGETIVSHHFPSYNTDQGKLVELYLSGALGKPNELSPYFINCLYAADRAVTWNKELKESYEEGKTLLFDRYTTSSILYQASTIEDLDERKRFIEFVCDFEYNKLDIKEPDNIIFLHAPFEVIEDLRSKRKENEGISNDIHERDREFLKKVYDNSMFVADFLNWDMIDCSKDNKMLSIEEIHEKVYSKIKK